MQLQPLLLVPLLVQLLGTLMMHGLRMPSPHRQQQSDSGDSAHSSYLFPILLELLVLVRFVVCGRWALGGFG